MRDVVHCEDQDFGKSVGLRFVCVRVRGNFFNDFPVAVWSGDLTLNVFGGKRAFVLDIIEEFFTSRSVDFSNPLAFFQEDAVNSNL